jgi:uncharacterized protein
MELPPNREISSWNKAMDTTWKTPKESFTQSIIRIIITLAGIQLIRAILYRIIGSIGVSPAGDITNAASVIITCVILWIVSEPDAASFGLTGFPQSRSKYGYFGFGTLLLILVGVNVMLDPSQLLPNFISCLIFPLFEEPIFRGWIWNRISITLPARGNGLIATLVTTFLFALWHLGYWDVVALHLPAGTTLPVMGHVMLMKMVIASIIGLAAGLLRWKTGNIYASILFHAFWNLFGR